MKPRLIPIIIGIILALIAAMMVNTYLGEQRRQLHNLQAGMAPKGVLVATEDIPQDTALTETMVKRVGVPEKFLQPYTTAEPADVVGKATVVPIAKGEQILLTKLINPESTTSLAAKTPPGKRAVTITLDPIAAVGGFVQPGDRVDILWTALVPHQGGGNPQAITLTLIQHALVLAVHNQLVQGSAQASAQQSQASSNAPVPITFALTPTEMELLLFAQEQGKLQLAMRPHSDTEVEEVPPVSIEAVKELLFGTPPNAAKAAPQREVEVYRGLEKAVVAIPEQQQQ